MMAFFKAAIFDLDGTLIDSMGIWETIDYIFLNRRDINVPDGYVEIVKTMSFEKAAFYTVERFGLPDSKEEVIQEWLKLALAEYSSNIELKPGVRSYLRLLSQQGVKMGVATTNQACLFEPVLHNNGVYNLFSAFTTLDEVEFDKSCPDIYLLAADKLKVKARECVVFEDTLMGVTGAKRAKMKVVGVFDRYSIGDQAAIIAKADKYIYDFHEMMDSSGF
ncbi:MAG: HAD family phosphatase [Syntrophomonadaceae bacterium]|jgi:HAD superfamily hydrolase (TIGR01509 family)|nr:HAD family phosphatase [Syntrophomonadaceae bacterium]